AAPQAESAAQRTEATSSFSAVVGPTATPQPEGEGRAPHGVGGSRLARRAPERAAEAEGAVLPGVAEVPDRLAQCLRGAKRFLQRAALEQHAEFVAAESRQGVTPAHLGLEERADLAE